MRVFELSKCSAIIIVGATKNNRGLTKHHVIVKNNSKVIINNSFLFGMTLVYTITYPKNRTIKQKESIPFGMLSSLKSITYAFMFIA